MKTALTFIAALLISASMNHCLAQGGSFGNAGMNGPPVTPRDLSAFQNIVNINGQDGFYLKKDLYLNDSYTIIDGDKVLGIPFLYIDWLPGALTTPDGRVYSDYTFKYNVHDQTVSFLNGKDSLEVNEDIKEFTLKVKAGDSMITSRFISSSQFGKGKTTYYEVLLDNEEGQLLKTNQKVVASLSSGVITSSSKKYLKLESVYFYYDKTTKKLIKIKPGTDIRSLLHLSEEEAKQLNTGMYDMANEQDVIQLMKAYFAKKKLKGF